MELTLSFTPERIKEIKQFARDKLNNLPDSVHWAGESDFDLCIDSEDENAEISFTLYHAIKIGDKRAYTLTSQWHSLSIGDIYSDEPLALPPLTFDVYPDMYAIATGGAA